MSRRRLLVICHGYPPYYGGAEHVAAYLARAAARTERFEVTVLTSDIGGRLPSRETRDGVNIVRVPAAKVEWTRHTVRELLSFLRSARRVLPDVIAEAKPDVVLAHFTLPAGAVAQSIQRGFGVPYSVVLHGSDVPGYQPRRFGLLYRVVRPFCRAVWRQARHVISVGAPLKELALQSWPEGRITVIPNGVDVARFQSLEENDVPVSNHWKRIVVVAQLIERKGIQHLLAALRRVPPSKRETWRCDVYGSGPYAAALRRMSKDFGLSECVTFKGLAEHDHVPGILQRADAYVLPALQEGLPLSLLEAMASSCPIVATTVGDIPSVIENEYHGLLVPPADEEALRCALQRVLSNPNEARRMGIAAQEQATKFDWSQVWYKYESVLFG